jgi:hypothetical protein
MTTKIQARHLDALDSLHNSMAPLTIRAVASDAGWTIAKTRLILDRLVEHLCADRRPGKPALYAITGRGQWLLFRDAKPGQFPTRRSG